MSISVDDLVASFSSSHIGQEAMDLAALQAQLSQVLFNPHPSSSSSTRGAHPSTPLACTPTSSSFRWERPELDRRRSNSVASLTSRSNADETGFELMDAMDEDERMVEDLLLPSSSVNPNATASQYVPVPPASPVQFSRRSRQASVSTQYSTSPYDISSNNTTSMFASTDPFYLAQLQAAQAPSLFAQFGNPAQQSPFLKGHTFQGHSLAQQLTGTTC